MVEEKLSHFRYKWVKRGGDIFVRQTTEAKAVKVVSERVIDDLLAKYPAGKTPAPKEPPKRDSTDRNLLFNAKSTNRYASANYNAGANRYASTNRYASANPYASTNRYADVVRNVL